MRLVSVTAAIIVVAVAICGTGSYIAIDRTLRSSFGAQLQTQARAVASIVDVHGGEGESR